MLRKIKQAATLVVVVVASPVIILLGGVLLFWLRDESRVGELVVSDFDPDDPGVDVDEVGA